MTVRVKVQACKVAGIGHAVVCEASRCWTELVVDKEPDNRDEPFETGPHHGPSGRVARATPLLKSRQQ